MKEIGICNRLQHSRKASLLSQKLNNNIISLGVKTWEEVGEIDQLDETYQELQSLFNSQEKIRSSLQIKLQTYESLKSETEHKEDKASQRIKSIHEAQGQLSKEILTIKKDIKDSEIICNDIRKKFTDSTAHYSEEKTELLKSKYTKERQRLANLNLSEKRAQSLIKKTENELHSFLDATRLKNSGIMNKVSKSSKDIAAYEAKLDALEGSKKKAFRKIGSFIFEKFQSDDPHIISLMKKLKLRPSEAVRLTRVIKHHSILAS